MKKPVVGFIAGVTAPPGKRMGHAGALISGGADTAHAKLAIMEACGFKVTRNPSEMGKLLKAHALERAPAPREGRRREVAGLFSCAGTCAAVGIATKRSPVATKSLVRCRAVCYLRAGSGPGGGALGGIAVGFAQVGAASLPGEGRK